MILILILIITNTDDSPEGRAIQAQAQKALRALVLLSQD